MQTVFAAVSLAASAIALIFSEVQGRDEQSGRPPDSTGPPRALLVWYGALVVAGFLATLPTRSPFAPGLTFGWGFLLGGVAGVYAALQVARPWRAGAWLARSVGLIGAATAGPAIILLVFGGYPNDALIGFAFAAVLLALIWRLCRGPLGAREGGDQSALEAHGADLFALVAVATAVGARLGLEHFGGSAEGTSGALRALPVLVGSVSGLAAVVPSSLAAAEGRRSAATRALLIGLIAAAIALVMVLILSWTVLGGWTPAVAAAAGAVGFAIMAWLASGADERGRPVLEVLGIALVALAVVAVGFKLLHGYGE
ncbi:MAG TPA: hypothetical protein VM283_09505, partial [Armatimonadota bacterium]|nr:hypothetical protein [Armatimonadota bacterium]